MALLEATKGGGIFFGLFDWRSKFAEAERRPSFTAGPGKTRVAAGLISLVEFIKAILFGVGADFADPEAADEPEVADLEAADPKFADPADKVEAADRVEAAEAVEAADPKVADPADKVEAADRVEAAEAVEAADPKVADPADNVEAADRVEAAEAAEAAEAPKATGVGGEIEVDEGEDTPPPLIKVVLVL